MLDVCAFSTRYALHVACKLPRKLLALLDRVEEWLVRVLPHIIGSLRL